MPYMKSHNTIRTASDWKLVGHRSKPYVAKNETAADCTCCRFYVMVSNIILQMIVSFPTGGYRTF